MKKSQMSSQGPSRGSISGFKCQALQQNTEERFCPSLGPEERHFTIDVVKIQPGSVCLDLENKS